MRVLTTSSGCKVTVEKKPEVAPLKKVTVLSLGRFLRPGSMTGAIVAKQRRRGYEGERGDERGRLPPGAMGALGRNGGSRYEVRREYV